MTTRPIHGNQIHNNEWIKRSSLANEQNMRSRTRTWTQTDYTDYIFPSMYDKRCMRGKNLQRFHVGSFLSVHMKIHLNICKHPRMTIVQNLLWNKWLFVIVFLTNLLLVVVKSISKWLSWMPQRLDFNCSPPKWPSPVCHLPQLHCYKSQLVRREAVLC